MLELGENTCENKITQDVLNRPDLLHLVWISNFPLIIYLPTAITDIHANLDHREAIQIQIYTFKDDIIKKSKYFK